MKKIASALIALAIALPMAAPAMAQQDNSGHDQHNGGQGRERGQGDGDRGGDHGGMGSGDHRGMAGGDRGRMEGGRGGDMHRNPFQRGQRFDRHRAPNYGLIDYRHYNRLRRPPRGYHWVRSGDDALLVAITTGVIASVVANTF